MIKKLFPMQLRYYYNINLSSQIFIIGVYEISFKSSKLFKALSKKSCTHPFPGNFHNFTGSSSPLVD